MGKTLSIYNDHPWMPWSDFEKLHQDMNRLFDYGFPSLCAGDIKSFCTQWSPAMDVYETDADITVKTEIPGLKKDEFEVAVENDVLSIQGEKKQEKSNKESNCLRTERFYGAFHRAVRLPSAVDTQNMQAHYKDGVLEVKLAKRQDAKPKRINVDVK